MKYIRIAAILFSIVLVLLLVLTAAATNYMYRLAIDARASKEVVSSANKVATVSMMESSYNYKEWMIEQSGFRHLYMTSEDGLKLHNYEIANHEATNKYAIIVHGYTSSGLSMAGMAKYFYDRNYHVIVPDLRGHGKSEGEYIAMGWDDRLDLLRLIDYITKKDAQSKIVLAGVSMGASAVLMASGEALPDNVKAIIEDCGYTSVWEEFSYQLDYLFSLPEVPLMYTTDWLTRYRAGYGFKEASALEQVKKSVTPTLFIHGTKDTFVPFYMMEELYDACNAPKQKLVVEGAGHCKSMETNPNKYKEVISSFLSQYGM